jgi:hypothetical protein
LIVIRYGPIFKLLPERKAKWVFNLDRIEAFDVDPVPEADLDKKTESEGDME